MNLLNHTVELYIQWLGLWFSHGWSVKNSQRWSWCAAFCPAGRPTGTLAVAAAVSLGSLVNSPHLKSQHISGLFGDQSGIHIELPSTSLHFKNVVWDIKNLEWGKFELWLYLWISVFDAVCSFICLTVFLFLFLCSAEVSLAEQILISKRSSDWRKVFDK